VQVRPLLERLVEQDKAFGVLVKPSKKSAAQKLQCVAVYWAVTAPLCHSVLRVACFGSRPLGIAFTPAAAAAAAAPQVRPLQAV
jgi:hypothetical protein